MVKSILGNLTATKKLWYSRLPVQKFITQTESGQTLGYATNLVSELNMIMANPVLAKECHK